MKTVTFEKQGTFWECSDCKRLVFDSAFNYCPWCGLPSAAKAGEAIRKRRIVAVRGWIKDFPSIEDALGFGGCLDPASYHEAILFVVEEISCDPVGQAWAAMATSPRPGSS